jgi:integrase
MEELERMKWEMVDYEEGELRLPGEITKTGAPRNISIDPALKAILALCLAKEGNIVSPKNLRLRKERLLKLAKVSSKRNALRHSFSTYHAAKHRNPGALQLILGQETPSVLFKHYIAAVRQADAELYFALRPPFAARKDDEKNELPAGLIVG